MVSSESVLANGLRHRLLHWAHDGDARGVVFLLHGFMDAAGTWKDVAPFLAAKKYSVFAPDFRGFGEGARVPAGAYYHFADYIFDVHDLIHAVRARDAALKDAPLFVVGHSMGGTVATMFTGAFPEQVTKLALLEGLGPPEMPAEVAPIRVRKWIEDVNKISAQTAPPKSMSEEDALKRLAMNHARVDREILRGVIPHLTKRADDGGLMWLFDPLHKTPSPTPFSATVFSAFARAVTCPALFVSGGPHGYHPPDEDARLAKYAQLTRREIENAGHMMHWTAPARLAEILLEFLA